MARASWYGEVVSNIVFRIVGPSFYLLLGAFLLWNAHRVLTLENDPEGAAAFSIPATLLLALAITFLELRNRPKAWRKALPYHFGVYPRVEDDDDDDPPQRVSA